MVKIPVLRWGQPYESLELDNVIHFVTGETLAKVSQANPGLLAKDIRKADRARGPCGGSHQPAGADDEKSGDLYRDATLPMGDGTQTPDEFARQQSASTGLPEHMCKFNMTKNHFVLSNMDRILDCLTRGLPLDILTRGYGEEGRGVVVSYQAQSPVLGLVLPSNSPGSTRSGCPSSRCRSASCSSPARRRSGRRTGWPRPSSRRVCRARRSSIYPGGAEMGAEVVSRVQRVKIFGSTETVKRYHGNPSVQVHGPGFSKILLATTWWMTGPSTST